MRTVIDRILRRVPEHSFAGLVFLFFLFLGACDAPDGGSSAGNESAPPTVDLPTDNRSPIAVMTFNIRYGTAEDGVNRWDRRRRHVFSVIRKQNPDIIGVQEALRFQLDELKVALPRYDEFGVGRDDGSEAGEYAAILYDRARFEFVTGGTFWFSDTPERVCSTSWGNTLCRICTWARFRDRRDGASFYHFNVHLDHASAESRLRSCRLLIERVDQRPVLDPVIITGDFNAGEQSPPIAFMTSVDEISRADGAPGQGARLVDTFRVIHADAAEAGTFGGWVGRTSGAKIDYVFVEAGGFEILGAGILHDSYDGAFPSDHYPVWAQLRLR